MMYVYFIQAGAGKRPPLKIGVASNLNRRLSALQTANHEELKVVASIECSGRAEAYAIENYLHKALSKRKIRGEWFYSCMVRIKKAMSKFENEKFLDWQSYTD